MKNTDIILLITTTFSALMAGLFYAYTCSVNLGLGKLSDIEYIKAMQSINREIQNPVFFSCFFGTLILIPLSAFLQYNQQATFKAWLLLTAAVTYAIGVFGVTVFGNVPLNEALENFNTIGVAKEVIQHQRALFETKWNLLNTVRTVFSILTVMLLIAACMNHSKVPVTAS
ncbi:DUF1772 domain-containing protein [Flavobacterium amniphilum]|uniref:anthrone oxygenase family protein n=1 Tax=Flavobacterium amniphilum TaxID=1834035 RepID=UPI00202AC1B8|nr:anthrone oxygenase family protein [Flavobacterium amniphilum]MCL9804320.1 DUF1772 domain-containing protein [Flavobacterium amniphilum]